VGGPTARKGANTMGRTTMARGDGRARARTAMGVGAAALAVGGLLLVTAAPALADSSGSGTTGGATAGGATNPGAVQLGGYTLSSAASGLSVFYEQPNFPLPATPTFEFNLGYSSSSFNSGPVGNANASAFWPGPVVAGGGGQLPLLLNPYLQQYAPPLQAPVDSVLPTSFTYPFQAVSAYPQGPPTATNNNGPVAMSSSASQTGAQANSALGQIGGAPNQSALPAGMLSIQAIGSTTEDTIDNMGNAVAEATSAVHGISFAGGLITVGAVTSTATSTSDGNQGKVSGSSTVTGLTIGGVPVAIDNTGLHLASTSQNLLGMLAPNVNSLLQTAGITISVANPVDTLNAASAQRQFDGLQIKIDLSQFDKDFVQLLNMLPAQLHNALNQLPLPTPYKQSITIDLGWVNVNAAASPSFSLLGGDTGSGDNGALSDLGGATSPLSGSDLGFGSSATPLASGATPSSTSPSGSGPAFAASQPVALFKGVGSGLILLGLLLAGLLAFLLMRADSAVGAMAAAPVCTDETP